MTLIINKELTRISGGTIPPGAVVKYQLTTDWDQLAQCGSFAVYYNEESFLQGKPPITLTDIAEWEKEGKFFTGGMLLIDKEESSPGNYQSWDQMFDDVAKKVIITITQLEAAEVAFLGELRTPQPTPLT